MKDVLAYLKDAGFIEREPRFHANGSQTTNTYSLNVRDDVGDVQTYTEWRQENRSRA